MARQYTFDQIEDYLDGNLPEGERLDFEREIESDAELKNEVSRHIQARKLNEFHARQQLKEKVKNIYDQVKAEESPSAGFSMMKIAAVIALFILAGGYFYVYQTYSSGKMVENAFEPYPNRYGTMGDQLEDTFIQGMKYYDMENYQKAIDIFREIPESDPQYVPAQFYLGVSCFSGDEPASSITAFQTVIAQDSKLYNEAATWYLSLALLENGDEDKAKEYLREIVNNDEYRADKAQKLLRKLDSPLRYLPGVD